MRLTQRKAILVVAILVVIACFFAVYLRLFTGKELWYEMFAAILGVIITAIITVLLLKGQTENEEKLEKKYSNTSKKFTTPLLRKYMI